MSNQIDSRPFLGVFAIFFISLGVYLASGYENFVFHLFTGSGVVCLLSFFLSKRADIGQGKNTRKRNLIAGTIIFVLAILIIWITFENRFDLETMAKTKSI
jgi:uncharacterized membrane protein